MQANQGFFDPEIARDILRAEHGDAPHAPFFELDLAALRHSRVERAKEILQIHREVQLHGFVGDDNPAFEAAAQRLARLLWE